jgi:hypothetical protein
MAAMRVGDEVDRVFDAASALERARVDGESKGLRQLLPVEALDAPCELHGALEQPTIEIIRDQAMTEGVERALRERRLRLTEAIEHHLPPQVDDRQLHGLRVRRALVRLQQDRHRHERRRHGRATCAGVAVRDLELGLESVVEELVPVGTEESEELAGANQPLRQPLLLLRVLLPRCPSHRVHRSPPRATRPRQRPREQRQPRMITYDHVWHRRGAAPSSHAWC